MYWQEMDMEKLTPTVLTQTSHPLNQVFIGLSMVCDYKSKVRDDNTIALA